MSIVLQSSGGGQITLQEPTTASNFTQTLPAAGGVTMVSGNMPAFSAYQSSAQPSLTNGVTTKILFQTEVFDTNNNFANSTFTPTVAGYYQLSAGFGLANASDTAFAQLTLYRNGTAVANGSASKGQTGTLFPQAAGSFLFYFNGSTDYAEIYAYTSGGAPVAQINATYFHGVLVKAA